MRAIVRDAYGSAEVLRAEDVETPPVADDEVRVRVRAAALDRGAWHLMAGRPYLIRPVYGLRRPRRRGLGTDLAGVVDAVGSKVDAELRPGDAVYGTASASFAESAVTSPTRIAHLPANLTFEQAAAVPVSGLTALQAVRDRGRVQPGQRVLVVGASGGVGTFAVQIAKAMGAEVTGVASTAKVELVRTLGADHVIDYEQSDIADGGERYDVVIDIGGNRSLARLRGVLAGHGRLVIVGGESGGPWLGGIDRQLRAMALSPFVRQHLGTFVSSENRADLEALRELIEAGSVSPVVDRIVSLDEVPAAMRDLESGRVRGKVVVAI